jgi:AcrR family transcriptional regulator
MSVSEPAPAPARRGQGQPPPADAARRRRGRPAKLSRQAILDAALVLLDREGADALTMRRLGSELGVEAMSLYRHVKDRDQLLEGLAGVLATEIEPQRGEVDWPDALRTFATELRAVARRHPAAFGLVGMRVLATPYVLRPIEEVLASLRSGGFTPARAILAYRVVSTYARGYAVAELSGFAIEVSADVPLPAVRSLGRRLASEPTESSFRAGLETIITGLRTQLD